MTRFNRMSLATATLLGGIAVAAALSAQETVPATQEMPIDAPMAGGMEGGPGAGRGEGPGRGMRGEMRGGPRGMMIDFTAIDTDADGMLSREELMTRAVERIGAGDANGDGALDRAEIIAVMPERDGGMMMIFAPDPRERQADRMFEFMGVEPDGAIVVTDLAERQVNGLLARADSDHDGAISKAESEVKPEHGKKGGRGHHGSDKDHGKDRQRD